MLLDCNSFESYQTNTSNMCSEIHYFTKARNTIGGIINTELCKENKPKSLLPAKHGWGEAGKVEENLGRKVSEERCVSGTAGGDEWVSPLSLSSEFTWWISGGRRLEEERGRHLVEVEETKFRMDMFDEETKAKLDFGGEEEKEASVVRQHLLSASLDHPCYIGDCQLNIWRWRWWGWGGGREAKWRRRGEQTSRVSLNHKISLSSPPCLLTIVLYTPCHRPRFPAHASVAHLLDWAVVLVQKHCLCWLVDFFGGGYKNLWCDLRCDQGGLGRGHFQLRTWGQGSRMVRPLFSSRLLNNCIIW